MNFEIRVWLSHPHFFHHTFPHKPSHMGECGRVIERISGGERDGWHKITYKGKVECYSSPRYEIFKTLPVHHLTPVEEEEAKKIWGALDGPGYYVFERFINDAQISALRGVADRLPNDKWKDDFGPELDSFRKPSKRTSHTCHVSENYVSSVVMMTLTKLRKLKVLSYWHTISKFTFLRTLGGSKDQAEHTDYDTDDDRYKTRIFPMGLLLALDEGATFKVRGKKVDIPKGGAVLFRGNLKHSGSGYEEDNIRAHMYIVVDRDDLPFDEEGNVVVYYPTSTKRPRGRAPRGKEWDGEKGTWRKVR